MVMKVAISTWDDRISPVFDVARRLLVVDIEGDAEIGRGDVIVGEIAAATRAKQLADLGVNVLICGAISRPLEQMLVSAGVTVMPHTCGPVEDVLRAFMSGQLTEHAFLMPGCCGRRGRFRGRRRRGRPTVDT